MFKRFLIVVLLLPLTVCVGAQLHVSILTCSPGQESYAKYGHTGIRVWSDSIDPVLGRMDVVYHYGVFDSDEPHFLSHFVRGLTDYRLGAMPTMDFCILYRMDHREVYEQELQLTELQKEAMVAALEENYQPQNRYYRYNFVYDNCATRPYRLLVKALGDSLLTPDFDSRRTTFRRAIRHYNGANNWAQVGIDLCFGWEADHVMSPDERLFLPEELMDKLAEASLHGRKLVLRSHTKPFRVRNDQPFWYSPWMVLLLLVLLCAVQTLYEWRKKHRLEFYLDRWLYFAWAVGGCILLYLALFSNHPFVHKNLNLLLLNPLWFLPFGLTFFYKGRQYLRYNQEWIFCYALLLLLVLLLGPQHCTLFVGLNALILLFRSAVGIHFIAVQDRWLNRHHHRRHYTAVLLAFLCLPLTAQASSNLVVVAVVDGLNQTALDQLEGHWNSGGFQGLERGIHYGAVRFPQLINGDVESVVSLMTGATPAQNGVSGGSSFDRKGRAVKPVFQDFSQVGIGTTERLSPSPIRVLTLADEFKLQNPKATVLAIGLNGPETVALAGHTAQAATWLDGKLDQWVASGYYNEGLPQEAAKQNQDSTLLHLAERLWNPLLDSLPMYEVVSERERLDRGFCYLPLYREGMQTHPTLNLTPWANEAVLQLALRMQQNRHLGEQQNDMLCLELTVKSPREASDFLSSAEQEDMYLRLDRQLQQFLHLLELRLGHNGFVFVLAGRPVQGRSQEQWKQAKIVGGQFDVDRCGALLNLYLMAKYGHQQWVQGVHGNQVYLDERLMEQKKLDVAAVEEEVARFMTEFEGVQAAWAGCKVPQIVPEQEGDPMPLQVKNAYNRECGGDVVFYMKPGWQILNPDGTAFDHVLEQNPTVPCFIYGGNVRHQELRTAQNVQEVYREIKRQLLIP